MCDADQEPTVLEHDDWQRELEGSPRYEPDDYNDWSMTTTLCISNDRLVVRIIAFTMLLSASPFRASAEDFTDAIHAYLQQTVSAVTPNGCIVVGIVDEHGS